MRERHRGWKERIQTRSWGSFGSRIIHCSNYTSAKVQTQAWGFFSFVHEASEETQKPFFFSLLVGPYMNKTMSITSIDLVPVFIIKEGSYVFQSLCNWAPYLRWISVFAAASTTAIVHLGDAICSINFCHTFPCQDVAHIDGTGCGNKKIMMLNQFHKLKCLWFLQNNKNCLW